MRLLRVLALMTMAALCVVPNASSDLPPPPTITYAIDGIAGANGWYRGSAHGNFVVLMWKVTGATNAPCDNAIAIRGPTTGTTQTCTAQNEGGTTTVTTPPIKIDAEPPTGVAALASRSPDVNGWYNHPVSIGWHGADATSGISTCTSVTFPSPGLDAASLVGGCTDNAGNTATASLSLQYDATPPTVSGLSVTSAESDNVVRWRSSSPADSAVVKRVARGSRSGRIVYRGHESRFTDTKIREGLEYRYLVQTFDEAANASAVVSTLALPRVVTLQAAYVPRTAGAPVLAWQQARGASYYHVQLFRNGRRVLAAWPPRTKLRLRSRWIWNGRRYRLTPGTYGWYVWAGVGPRAAARYKALGRATFIATRAG